MDKQTSCIDALLQLGHSVDAFDLSAQFLHPRGLLEALDLVDADSISGASQGVAVGLNSRFRELVRAQAAQKGTENVPFATYCMQWLEAKGRPVAAVEIGKLAPSQLNSFLEVCPSVHVSVDSSICLSIRLYVCLSIYFTVCLPVYLFDCMSVCLLVCMYVCLSVSSSLCLSIYQTIYLSVCPSCSLMHLVMESSYRNIAGRGVAGVNFNFYSIKSF